MPWKSSSLWFVFAGEVHQNLVSRFEYTFICFVEWNPGVVGAHLHHFTQSSSGSMDLPWKVHGMPWRPKSGFGPDPKNLSFPSILCRKGCYYQFSATDMDFGVWCLVCHLPELECELQVGPLKRLLQGMIIRNAISPWAGLRCQHICWHVNICQHNKSVGTA